MDQLPYILMALGILALVLVGIAIAGACMPQSHAVFRSLDSKQPPDTLWAIVSDFKSEPSWHPEINQVDRLPDRNGHEVWRETYRGGYPIQLETLEVTPPRRLVRIISDEKGPFSGRWEYELKPTNAGTQLTITEYGEIPNPFFRFMARVFMNPATYVEMYLKALAVKLGEAPADGKVKT